MRIINHHQPPKAKKRQSRAVYRRTCSDVDLPPSRPNWITPLLGTTDKTETICKIAHSRWTPLAQRRLLLRSLEPEPTTSTTTTTTTAAAAAAAAAATTTNTTTTATAGVASSIITPQTTLASTSTEPHLPPRQPPKLPILEWKKNHRQLDLRMSPLPPSPHSTSAEITCITKVKKIPRRCLYVLIGVAAIAVAAICFVVLTHSFGPPPS